MATKTARRSRKASLAEFRDGREEMNLIEFPFATLSERAGVSKVLEFQLEEYDRVLGKPVVRKLTVTGDAKYGLPTAKDEEVYLGLLQLTKLYNDFGDPKVLFTRSELIRLMGWKNRDWSYHRIATALARLTGVRLFYENAWRDNLKKKFRTKGGFGLLDSFELRDGRVRTSQGEEEERLSEFRWNSVIFESFQSGYLKKIDYDKIRVFSPAARRLYRYLDKHFYPPRRTTLRFNLKELAREHIGLSRNYDVAQLKRVLAKPITELESSGFINKERRRFLKPEKERGEWQVTFTLKGYGALTKSASKRSSHNIKASNVHTSNRPDSLDKYLDQLPEQERTELEAKAMEHNSNSFLQDTIQSESDDGPLAAECRRQIVKAFLKSSGLPPTKKVA